MIVVIIIISIVVITSIVIIINPVVVIAIIISSCHRHHDCHCPPRLRRHEIDIGVITRQHITLQAAYVDCDENGNEED